MTTDHDQFDSLEERVREVARIAGVVAPEFRVKCFELLLGHVLATSGRGFFPSSSPWPIHATASAGSMTLRASIEPVPAATAPVLQTNPLIESFLRKSGVSMEEFRRLLGTSHGNISFLIKPSGGRDLSIQMEWGLMVALHHGLRHGTFRIDPAEWRLVCMSNGVFDGRSFAAALRRSGEFCRAALEAGGEAQPLSSKGVAALSELVCELVRQAR